MIGLILRQAMTPVAAGIVVGVAGALAFGSVVASLLFDIQPSDPAVISGVIVVVASTGLATCAWAARRGLSIEPMAALREE